MPKIETVVRFDLKEIQDAVIELAKGEAGANTGGSTVVFEYDSGTLVFAVVAFQRTKRV